MNLPSALKKIATAFQLPKKLDHYTYLFCTPEEIIIRNFLGGCPDPVYITFGNKHPKDRPKKLASFIASTYFKQEQQQGNGCVITHKEILRELAIAKRIPGQKLCNKTLRFYQRLLDNIEKQQKLILISPQKNEQVFNEILLHELVHELVDINKLRPLSWKWNEGLVTYLTHYALNKQQLFEKEVALTNDKMEDIYDNYPHQWALLFKPAKSASTRKKILLRQLKKLKA